MDLVQALLLGVLQGVTEWLPVSSSGHLVLAQHFFGVSASVFFDVALHLGTLTAVVLFFRRQIVDLFLRERRMLVLLVWASIPAALAGFLLRDFFASLFSNVLAVGIAFVFTGCLLYATKRASGNKDLNARNSLLIGLLQAVSIIPPGFRGAARRFRPGCLRVSRGKRPRRFRSCCRFPLFWARLRLKRGRDSRSSLI